MEKPKTVVESNLKAKSPTKKIYTAAPRLGLKGHHRLAEGPEI